MTPVRLTLLYDAECSLCRSFRGWLEGQPLLVPLELVPCGSESARLRFPTLDHERTSEEITIVSDAGAIWTGGAAWVMALWATRTHRPLAERLSTPAGLPLARAAAYAAAGIRRGLSASGGGGTIDRCVDSCRPLGQG